MDDVTTSAYAYNTDQPHTLAKVTGAGTEKDYQYDARATRPYVPGKRCAGMRSAS